MEVLVTGAAGFIGFHAARVLLRAGAAVTGVDDLNAYYDPGLKRARLEALAGEPRFTFLETDIGREGALRERFRSDAFTHVLHLAAQAGVRYSIDEPFAYERANVAGHLEVLEFVRRSSRVVHTVYASSSSVYGDRADGPFKEEDRCDAPASLYAATKRSCELMSETYARLYNVASTGLRFFTVYGPWGRPDMAYWIFSERIFRGLPIQVFGAGALKRDFTHIEDVTALLPRILERPPTGAPPHILYNIGSARPTIVSDLVDAIEQSVGKSAIRVAAPKQPGDVGVTSADVSKVTRDFGFAPRRSIENGIPEFVDWLRDYMGRRE